MQFVCHHVIMSSPWWFKTMESITIPAVTLNVIALGSIAVIAFGTPQASKQHAVESAKSLPDTQSALPDADAASQADPISTASKSRSAEEAVAVAKKADAEKKAEVKAEAEAKAKNTTTETEEHAASEKSPKRYPPIILILPSTSSASTT